MSLYDAEILMDGWLRLRVSASSAAAARRLVGTLRPRIVFVDDDGAPVGVIDDVPLFTVVIEEVEESARLVQSPYHEPVREGGD